MKNKVLNVLSIILGLMFINSGLNKFLNYLPVPDNLPEEVVKDDKAIAEIVWLLPLIGFVEVTGGLLMLLPKTRAIGALVLLPVMTGVLLTHIFVNPMGLPIALVLAGIFLWALMENRHKYRALLG